MNRHRLLVFFALLLATAASPAYALDLKECIQRGMANSDRILAAKAEYDKARMERYAAIPNLLPQVSVTASKLWLDVHSTIPETNTTLPPNTPPEQAQLLGAIFSAMDFSAFTAVPDHNDDLTLKAYQPITMLPQLVYYDRISSDVTELAKLGYQLTSDQIALYLGGAYFNVLIAQKNVRALDRALEQVDRLLKDGQNMMAQGLITKADLLKFQIRQSDVKIQLLRARNDEAQAKSYLAKLLDLPIEQIDCQEGEIDLEKPKELGWYLQQGEKDRLELRMTSLQEEMASSARSAAYLNLIPQIGAMAQADWNDDGLDTTPDRTYSYGFVLSWNFWGLGADVLKARAASYANQQYAHTAKASRIEIQMSIEKAWRDFSVALEAVDTTQRTLEQAEENFRIEQNRYKVGQSTAYDLMGAQTQLTGAETGYNASIYGAKLAAAALQLAIGKKPFPEFMGGNSNE